MENKARITYRFDHNKKDYKQSFADSEQNIYPRKVTEKQTLNNFTTDFEEWQSPFDMDTEHLTKLEVSAAPVESNDDDMKVESLLHDGVMTYSETLENNDRSVYARNGLFRMLFSFFGALAGGLLLGYFALQFFSNSIPSDQAIAPSWLPNPSFSELEDTTGNSAGNDVGLDDFTDSQNAQQTPVPVEEKREAIALNLPATSLYLLQNGMFSSEEKAIEASNALKQKGFASTAVRTDHIYIYAGILTLRDDALQLSHYLQEEGFETYIKTFEMPAVESLNWTGNSKEQLVGYFKEGRELVNMLSELSYLYIQPHSPNGLSESAMEQLHERHKAWSNHALGMGQSMPEEIQNTIQKMNKAMNTAVTALDEYNKSPSTSYVWQVQEAMLDYAHEEKTLMLEVRN